MKHKAVLFIVLSVIIVLGFVLRAVDLTVPFFDDEPDWVVQASSISIKDDFFLPLGGVGHSPLAIYLTYISGKIFGETPAGYRVLLLIMNTVLIWLMFVLGSKCGGRKAGVFSALLCAVNTFIIYYSREIGCDGYHLFFCVLCLIFFIKAVEKKSSKMMLLFGFSFGVALLNKILAIFILPACLFYLYISKENRIWFKRPALYLGIAVSFLIISPYLLWLFASDWEHFRSNSNYMGLLNLPVIGVTFLGRFFSTGEYPHEVAFGREYMSFGMGLLLLTGVGFSFFCQKRKKAVFLMQLLFLFLLFISVVGFEGWPVHFNIAIIPAIVCTAVMLSFVWKRNGFLKAIVICGIVFFLAQLSQLRAQVLAAYDYHSRISSKSSIFSADKNMNEVVSIFSEIADKYDSSLIVMPNPEWDTAASYFEAGYKRKVSAPLPLIYRSVKYRKKDFKRVLVLSDRPRDIDPFKEWAKDKSLFDSKLFTETINTGDKRIMMFGLFLSLKKNSSLPDLTSEIFGLLNHPKKV